MWSTGQVRKGVKRNRKKKNNTGQSGHREVCSFRFGCYRRGEEEGGRCSKRCVVLPPGRPERQSSMQGEKERKL